MFRVLQCDFFWRKLLDDKFARSSVNSVECAYVCSRRAFITCNESVQKQQAINRAFFYERRKIRVQVFFLPFFHGRLPFKRPAYSSMCIQAYKPCKLGRVLVLEMRYWGALCEMESSWIGKCEVDVSKMPRFPRQRIRKVCMVMVFVTYMSIYIWSGISFGWWKMGKWWEMNGLNEAGGCKYGGNVGFTTPVIPFLSLRTILEGGLS